MVHAIPLQMYHAFVKIVQKETLLNVEGKVEEVKEEEETVYKIYNITEKDPKTQPVIANQLVDEQNIITDTDDNEFDQC